MPKVNFELREMYQANRGKTKTISVLDKRFKNIPIGTIKWDGATYGYGFETHSFQQMIPLEAMELVIKTIASLKDGTYTDGLPEF